METKICCRCKIERNIDEYTFKNKIKNIRNITCKHCFVAIRKKWYINNKKNIIDKNTINKNKNILWFEEYKKTLKYNICGENHPGCLDFHHIDPLKKEISISIIARGTYSNVTIMKEINKCIVLCSNCHRKLHYDEKSHQ